MMDRGILLDLKSIEILSESNITRLRQYIIKKYPNEGGKKQALVFADAVKRIVSRKVPEFDVKWNDKLKGRVIKNALKKPTFSVDLGDVFVSIVAMRERESSFFDELAKWVGSVINKDLTGESVKDFISDVYLSMDENPDLSIESVIQKIDETRERDEDSLKSVKIVEDTSKQEDTRSETVNSLDNEQKRRNICEEFISYLLGIKKRVVLFCLVCLVLVSAGGAYLSGWFSNDSDTNNCLYASAQLQKADTLKYEKEKNQIEDQNPNKDENQNHSINQNENEKENQNKTENETENKEENQNNNENKNGDIDQYLSQQLNRSLNHSILMKSIAVKKLNMRATAYDLSYESCEKHRDHPEYGITFSGKRAVFGRTVAVDPETIPLGTRLYINFPEKYSHLNGIYVAEDIGSLVKGDIIDIFLGEDKEGEDTVSKKVKQFGVQPVEVYILR